MKWSGVCVQYKERIQNIDLRVQGKNPMHTTRHCFSGQFQFRILCPHSVRLQYYLRLKETYNSEQNNIAQFRKMCNVAYQ